MKWWVFNEDQLGRALAQWRREEIDAGADSDIADEVIERIQVFLNSEAARANKLRGDLKPVKGEG